MHVTERHVGQRTIDPAAETELAKMMEDVGFTVIDHKIGNRKQADVIVEGEAFSEFATRQGDLVSVKARVEINAVKCESGERLATDRQTEIVVDLSEQIAGKTALQCAAAEIGIRLIPKDRGYRPSIPIGTAPKKAKFARPPDDSQTPPILDSL